MKTDSGQACEREDMKTRAKVIAGQFSISEVLSAFFVDKSLHESVHEKQMSPALSFAGSTELLSASVEKHAHLPGCGPSIVTG